MVVRPSLLGHAALNSLNPSNALWAHIGGLLAIGIGLADIWAFHAFPVPLAIGFVVAGLAAMGVNVAWQVAQAQHK